MIGPPLDIQPTSPWCYPRVSGLAESSKSRGLQPGRYGLLVIDMIYGCIEAHLGYIAQSTDGDPQTSYYANRMDGTVIPAHKLLLSAARASGFPVLYTILGSHFDDYLDISPHVRPVIEYRGVHRGTHGFEIVEPLQPREGDIVLTKLGSGAFGTTAIDEILRGAGVQEVVIAGTVTNGCVLTTALGAWDLGYGVTVAEDACCTLGQRLHDQALDVMRGCQITVVGVKEVLSHWAASSRESA